MKYKLAVFTCMAFLGSCSKENQLRPEQLINESIHEKVLGLKTIGELNAFDSSDVRKLISYLDKSVEPERIDVLNKIQKLQAAEPLITSAKTVATTLDEEPPTIAELMQVSPFSGNMDYYSESNYIPAGPWGLDIDYRWTVGYQATYIYIIKASDKFQLADQGPTRDLQGRYPIQNLVHQSSFISGFAPGVSWIEIGNNNIFNPGGYWSFLFTAGTINALGINAEISSGRYVNTGLVVQGGPNYGLI